MQITLAYPDEFGNQGNEMFRGQSQGFSQGDPQGQAGFSQGQNLNQNNSQNQGALGQRSQSQNGSNNNSEQPRRRGRGFASMDPARVSEIASMGGKAAHQQGVAHEWTPEEARRAGRKGGQSSRTGNAPNNRTTSAGGSE
jgi:uncharacterized protein